MRFFYTLGVYAYVTLIRVASLFNAKAKLWINGRKKWRDQLPEHPGKMVFWFHCASLGEFDQGIPVMERMKNQFPDAYILVTFFSPSGMEHYHKRKHVADWVQYLPADTKRNARDFVHHWKPNAAFFVKYEFWLNYLNELGKSSAKLYGVSTLLRPNQRFFKPWGGVFRKALRQFDQFFVQNLQTEGLLRGIGIHQVTVSGDTRYDRLLENKKTALPHPVIQDFVQGANQVLVVGSAWEDDLEVISDLVNDARFDRVILAMHQVNSSTTQHLKSRFSDSIALTELMDHPNTSTQQRILLLDTIGHLTAAYSVGDVAYVGGAFHGALHNILEPGVYGLPVLFGPKHQKFPEAQDFIDSGIGFVVKSQVEVTDKVNYVLKDLELIKEKILAFMNQRGGASNRIMDVVSKDLLPR